MSNSGESTQSRISQMIKELGFKNPTRFALDMKEKGSQITQPTISRYVTGNSKPTIDFYDFIEKHYRYSGQWLRTGEGEKKLDTLDASSVLRTTDGNVRSMLDTLTDKQTVYTMTPKDYAALHILIGKLEMIQQIVGETLKEVKEITGKGITITKEVSKN